MPYVLKKTFKGKKYFYLIKTVRVGGKWKKFTTYIGKGNLSRGRLNDLKKKYSKILERRAEAYLESADPLLGLLSAGQAAELEKVRAMYKKHRMKMPEVIKRRWYEWFLATFTYNTNAIEESTVNLLETSMILFEGLTPPDKTTREVREVESHGRAFDYLTTYRSDVNKAFVCRLHHIMTSEILGPEESGKFRSVQVFIRGADHMPPKPEDVGEKFKELMFWYRGNKKKYHPVVVAAHMHTAFESIHPFVDYNGRTGRLLLNFILMKHGFPPIAIAYRGRAEYYRAIQAAVKGDLGPFVRLIYRYLIETRLE